MVRSKEGDTIHETLLNLVIPITYHRPFLEGSLKTLGLLNYHPIAELMAQPVITLDEINRVSTVHLILSTKTHNGFPVVGKNGHLRGFILRKTLCNIIKLKAFSSPINSSVVGIVTMMYSFRRVCIAVIVLKK